MDIEFRKFTDYNRGIMYEILKDAYSFDERCAICWDEKLETIGCNFSLIIQILLTNMDL